MDRLLRWLFFRRFPQLRSMLSEIVGINLTYYEDSYVAGRCSHWREIAREVLYGWKS